MIYLLMLKQCILHLRVRDKDIEISCDSKYITNKMYLMDLMVDLVEKVGLESLHMHCQSQLLGNIFKIL